MSDPTETDLSPAGVAHMRTQLASCVDGLEALRACIEGIARHDEPRMQSVYEALRSDRCYMSVNVIRPTLMVPDPNTVGVIPVDLLRAESRMPGSRVVGICRRIQLSGEFQQIGTCLWARARNEGWVLVRDVCGPEESEGRALCCLPFCIGSTFTVVDYVTDADTIARAARAALTSLRC